MRSRPTNIRGRIGLIEAGTGLIVGETILVDCYPAIGPIQALLTISHHQVDDLDLLKKWKYPWIFYCAKRYETPIPYRHPKGAVIWVKSDLKEKERSATNVKWVSREELSEMFPEKE